MIGSDAGLAGATIGLTGASGFLGRALGDRFVRDGFAVVAFVRHPETQPPGPWTARRYELGGVPDLAGVDVLVHCAFAAQTAKARDVVALNVDGTVRLFRAARERGVPFVFMSSVNAIASVDSAYARSKRAIEAEIADDALVLRAGLIVGEGGVFASLLRVARLPVLPLVDGGRQLVQVIGVDDLYGAMLIALRSGLRGIHAIVANPPLRLRNVVTALARRRSPVVNIPYPLAFAAAAAAEAVGLRLPVTTENLRGLRGARAQTASSALERLGWTPPQSGAVLAEIASK